MADELKTEEEQIEEFRAWWSNYGAYVIGGIVLGVAALFGWNTMQDSKLRTQTEASALYETLADHVTEGRLEEAETVSAQIAADYANTAYVGQSKLAMARLYMDRNRDEDAANALRELLTLEGFNELKLVGSLRLSRILLYQGKAEEALEAVADPKGQAFAARYAEARGDALLVLERYADARAAYTDAIEQPNADQTLDVGFVRLKLFDLPPDAIVESDDELVEPDGEELMDAADAAAAEAPVADETTDDADAMTDAEESPQ
ncbi:MAG: tetratricopeptide repeat protein [Pseudomonadota bacterium]